MLFRSVSGPGRPETAPESTIRARIAVELGVSGPAIKEISTAQTTREEAQRAAALLLPKNRHVLLVTESLHMLRAKLVFETAGFIVSPAPSDNFPKYAHSPEERLLLMRGVLMHSSGLLYYWLAGFFNSEAGK